MNKGGEAKCKVNIKWPFQLVLCKKDSKNYGPPRNIWVVAFVYTSAAGSKAEAG
jgi:hypothetical protein